MPLSRSPASEFEAFARHTYLEVCRYLAKRVAIDDVEDIAQECFASLWSRAARSLPGDEPTDCFERALLYRIADNRVADHWRAQARHQRRWEAATSDAAARLDLAVLSRHDEVDLLPDWLGDHLGDLAPDAIFIFALVSQGFSVAEIASTLEITPNAVSSRLKRARAKVRAFAPGAAQLPQS